ncbi:related to Zinc finger protein [Sporisorium reilianum SRZ2]|uniref:Related to Zinc finger protein n=1 Tax=Sporisorium reilianum (strain SRZ2) TaxID=999809 RepID=E6ZJM7_SPORE|nr:related to Zinc finger protein [Sporisorium reilianum SRZ2]
MMTIEAGGSGPEQAPFASSIAATSEAGPSRRPDVPSHRCSFEGCTKSYTKASKLAQHVRSHTGERPFVCDHPGCGASYMRNEHLKAHQRRHLDPSEKPFACDQEDCGLRFWTSSQLKNHVQACHVDHMSSATGASAAHDYVCTEAGCDLTFHKRKHLRQHIRDHHSSALPPDLQDGEASVRQELPQSSTATALPFACQFPGCGKLFPTNSKRKTHYRTHEQGRYTCSMDHSQPQQANQSDGPIHSMIYTFPTWSALQAHMKEAHPPICPWPGCGKQFQRQDNLRAHYRRHEDRKLRLEMEAKLLEGSHENELNHLRADLSDDSYASMSEEEQEDHHELPAGDFYEDRMSQDHGVDGHDWQQPSQQNSSSSTTIQSPALSEEQLINKAAQLHSTRPRRGGVFRNLSSPALSVITSVSGKTASARLGSTATSITSPRGAPSAFPCTWNGCSKVFTRKSTLSVHVRTSHLGERPFECSGCGRRFAHKHLVSRHRRVCTGTPSSPEQSANGGSRLRFSSSHGNMQKDAEDDSDQAGSGTDQDGSSNASSETDEQGDRSPATHAANETSSAVKPRLLDLLTGRGYSTPNDDPDHPTSSKRSAADEGESAAPKRRRTTRDRVFGCPWTNICRALDQQTLDPDLPLSANDDGRLDPSSNISTACEHRYKRLYDLRRHLRAQHGLDLTTDELSAITHQTAWTHVHHQ